MANPFQDAAICTEVMLVDGHDNVVGVARDVPYVGRLFEYRHKGAPMPTTFRFENKSRATYARGYKWWIKTPSTGGTP